LQDRLTQDGGWCVFDASRRNIGNTSVGIDMLLYYRPLFSQAQARHELRLWTGVLPQDRKDGAATYYKFLAFGLTDYARLLHIDSDVIVTELPDPFLRSASTSSLYFAAEPENKGLNPTVSRSYPTSDHVLYRGLSSHCMLLTPGTATFGQLLSKAASGQYLAYTNSDQDVLETIFTTTAHWAQRLPKHVHRPDNATLELWQRGGPARRASCGVNRTHRFSAPFYLAFQSAIDAAVVGLHDAFLDADSSQTESQLSSLRTNPSTSDGTPNVVLLLTPLAPLLLVMLLIPLRLWRDRRKSDGSGTVV
jgi:hypothetical protein